MKKEDAKKLTEQAFHDLEEALKAGQSDALKRYLNVMGRFHRYSFGNCLLILIQKPDATQVAGFRRWLQLGRSVRKGETGIGIIAPMVYRKQNEPSEADGEDAALRGFKVVHVFDISQTDGEALPELASIGGDPGELLCGLETLIRESGIVLQYEELPYGTKGESRKGEIAVDVKLPQAERFSVLAHELAHEWLHDAVQRKDLTKTVRETEAEAVAYVVCQAVGLDCSTRSADYIQMYQGTAETLAASLDRIQKTAMRIIESLHDPRTSAKEGERHVA